MSDNAGRRFMVAGYQGVSEATLGGYYGGLVDSEIWRLLYRGSYGSEGGLPPGLVGWALGCS